ncbi:hypothetical protein PsorP6_002571 [Peronosclerospora sorghi]|uniref:Uncharacterized protein n=1 Tax=Peronosclerospora sorghi TaxID=230839 RepID=A0ACC0WRX3_9STRA|nr:hypothetical protein PsorP6_002571 [Peronosclerospora sorghi]
MSWGTRVRYAATASETLVVRIWRWRLCSRMDVDKEERIVRFRTEMALSPDMVQLCNVVFDSDPFPMDATLHDVAVKAKLDETDATLMANVRSGLQRCNFVKKVYARVYALKNERKMIEQLWTNLKPDVRRKGGRITKELGEIGFQGYSCLVYLTFNMQVIISILCNAGTDTMSDFRSMGIFSLVQLNYFSKQRKSEALSALVESNHPVRWYPFAVTGINVTAFFMELYPFVAKGNDNDVNAGVVQLHDVYATIFTRFNNLWVSSNPRNVMAFPSIFHIRSNIFRRLASDRVLPDFLLHVNKIRGTNHFIIIGYFMVATSLVLLLHGDTETLLGVYTYASLGLMTLFGIGCMLLKFKRAEIPRTVIAPWWSCILGVSMVAMTFMGNLLGDPTILTYFALYFIAVLAVVYIMFERTFLLRMCLYCMRQLCPSQRNNDYDEVHSLRTGARGGQTIARFIREINEPAVFFFCKTPNLNIINKAILYVRTNEQTHSLFIVHCHTEGTAVPEGFKETVSMFDHVNLKIKLSFLSVEGSFGPAMVEWVSRKSTSPRILCSSSNLIMILPIQSLILAVFA